MSNQSEKIILPLSQSPGGIRFVQVPEEVGVKMDAFPIENRSSKTTLSPEQAKNRLKSGLEKRYWWLSSEWSSKTPREQVLVGAPKVNFDIYNFSAPLTDAEIDRFRNVAALFSQLTQRVRPLTFLISDTQTINPNNNQPLNGEGQASSGVITIEPNARLEIPHRIGEVENFMGTLVHEVGHFFVDSTTSEGERRLQDWIAANGWAQDHDYKPASGQPSKKWILPIGVPTITDYARISPSEDFADSLVAAVFARDRLDPKRQKVLDSELGTDKVDVAKEIAVATKRVGSEIVMPSVSQVYYYLRRPLGVFTRM